MPPREKSSSAAAPAATSGFRVTYQVTDPSNGSTGADYLPVQATGSNTVLVPFTNGGVFKYPAAGSSWTALRTAGNKGLDARDYDGIGLTYRLLDLPLMRRVGAHSARLHTLTGELTRLEGESDTLNEEGLRALFKGATKANALDFIIGSELYDHLEKVCDRFEDVAHVMNDIVIEHV